MPLLIVRATPTAFDRTSRDAFVRAVTQAAVDAESMPDDPLVRLRAVVVWSDLAEGDVYWGGVPSHDLVRMVLADYQVGDGVLDPVRRAAFAAAFHEAALEHQHEDESRVTRTSVVFHDVAEGRWGRDGTVVRLPDMARDGGFAHLAPIASS